jgi:hypothetical protein
MIYRGMQNQKKEERGRCNDKSGYEANSLYILGLEHGIDMLSVVLCELKAVRENHPAVRDEMVMKMYGKENEIQRL